jgi:hypothetical protein
MPSLPAERCWWPALALPAAALQQQQQQAPPSASASASASAPVANSPAAFSAWALAGLELPRAVDR